MESDFGRSGFWRNRRTIENPHDALASIHYRRIMNVQTGFEFGFESGQFSLICQCFVLSVIKYFPKKAATCCHLLPLCCQPKSSMKPL